MAKGQDEPWEPSGRRKQYFINAMQMSMMISLENKLTAFQQLVLQFLLIRSLGHEKAHCFYGVDRLQDEIGPNYSYSSYKQALKKLKDLKIICRKQLKGMWITIFLKTEMDKYDEKLKDWLLQKNERFEERKRDRASRSVKRINDKGKPEKYKNIWYYENQYKGDWERCSIREAEWHDKIVMYNWKTRDFEKPDWSTATSADIEIVKKHHSGVIY